MIEKIEEKVKELLSADKTGHGISHINRVRKLALNFAKEEGANIAIVEIASLLHDVDDYKLVSDKDAKNLTNARRIMDEAEVPNNIKEEVITIIKNMGYKNALRNIRPKTLEGKIVSDADMCDAMGSNGLLRVLSYTLSSKGSGIVFDKDIFPNVNISFDEYSKRTDSNKNTAINHIFEKMLKIPNLVVTKSAKKETVRRKQVLVEFLQELFIEEDLPNWQDFLKTYLKENNL